MYRQGTERSRRAEDKAGASIPLAAPYVAFPLNRVLPVLGGLAFIPLAVLIREGLGLETALVVLSIGHVWQGVFAYAVHGGALITPTGLYFLSSALLVGVPGLYMVFAEPDLVVPAILTASALTLFANSLTLGGLYAFTAKRQTQMWRPRPYRPGSDSARFAWGFGFAFLVVGLVLSVTSSGLATLPAALAYVGVSGLFLGVIAAGIRSSRVARYMSVMAVAAGFGAFLEFVFTGFGRIVVGGLLLSGLVLANMVHPRSRHKAIVIMALVPGVLAAGWIGLSRSGKEVHSLWDTLSPDAVASAVIPLEVFGELIEEDGEPNAFPRRYGMTYAEGLSQLVPREYWEGKPLGLPTQLTAHRTPERVEAGVTWAALSYGEWHINFGRIGFLLMPLVLAYLLYQADSWQRRLLADRRDRRSLVVAFLAFASLAGGLIEFQWMGFSNFVSRSGLRLLLLVPVYYFFAHVERVRAVGHRG